MRELQPGTFHRAVRKACGGQETATLSGAHRGRGLRVRAEGDRARGMVGCALSGGAPRKTLTQDAARRRTGRLAESTAGGDRQRGRAPPERGPERG